MQVEDSYRPGEGQPVQASDSDVEELPNQEQAQEFFQPFSIQPPAQEVTPSDNIITPMMPVPVPDEDDALKNFYSASLKLADQAFDRTCQKKVRKMFNEYKQRLENDTQCLSRDIQERLVAMIPAIPHQADEILELKQQIASLSQDLKNSRDETRELKRCMQVSKLIENYYFLLQNRGTDKQLADVWKEAIDEAAPLLTDVEYDQVIRFNDIADQLSFIKRRVDELMSQYWFNKQ